MTQERLFKTLNSNITADVWEEIDRNEISMVSELSAHLNAYNMRIMNDINRVTLSTLLTAALLAACGLDNPQSVIEYIYGGSKVHALDPKVIIGLLTNPAKKSNIHYVCLNLDLYDPTIEILDYACSTSISIDLIESKVFKNAIGVLESMLDQNLLEEDLAEQAKVLIDVLYTILNDRLFTAIDAVKVPCVIDTWYDTLALYCGAFAVGFIGSYLLTSLCLTALDGLMGASIYAPSKAATVVVAV